jgi:predicted enzyme related to lactoylglutathione lyase
MLRLVPASKPSLTGVSLRCLRKPSPPQPSSRLVEFPADDADRARRFWEGLLGVPFAEREEGEGRGWQTRMGGVGLGLHERGVGCANPIGHATMLYS